MPNGLLNSDVPVERGQLFGKLERGHGDGDANVDLVLPHVPDNLCPAPVGTTGI